MKEISVCSGVCRWGAINKDVCFSRSEFLIGSYDLASRIYHAGDSDSSGGSKRDLLGASISMAV